MQIHTFTIPIHHSGAATEELNKFLSSHKVLEITQELVQDGGNSAWTFCVSIEQGGSDAPAAANRRPRIDYKEVLNEPDFAVYSRLRNLRKQLAEAEGVPVYTLFSNEQLAAMVQQRVTTATELAAITGVGPARVEKYGQQFIELLAQSAAPASAAATAATPATAAKP